MSGNRARRLLACSVLALAALACSRDPGPAADEWRCLAYEPPAPRARPDGDFAFARWQPPAHAELRLAELEGSVEGAPAPEAGVLARFEGEALAAFASEPLGGEAGVRFTGPAFEPPLAGAARIRVRLRPGGATRVRVIPFGTGIRDERMKRSHQAVEIALERDAAPGRAVELVVDVGEVLRGNWAGATAGSELERLELELPGATAERARLERVAIEDERARFAGAAAARRGVERQGIVRPSWYVNGGARVTLAMRVPEGAPELRWHEAAEGAASAAIRVRAGETWHALARSEPAPGWAPRNASLADFAGREVVLELAAEGEGTALFGDPRVVSPRAPASTPDVLLYLVDTLRADAVGAFGSPRRGVTPVLDRLAEDGLVFAHALTTSPWTKPAIPTLLTGLHPAAHGVGATSYTDLLPPGVPTLQGAFRAGGWRAGSFAANPLGSTLSGLERGFGAAYTPRHWRGAIGDLEHPEAAQLHAALLGWLEEEPDLPFFAYLHTLEPHEWERPRYADPQRGWDAYDAAVHDADRRLGELLDALTARGRRPLVVVVSDHGESLGEHGVLHHGTTLWQTELHVPLLFWADGALPPMTVPDPVSLQDVAPTLLELAGLAPLPHATGTSLASFPREGRAPAAAPAGVSSELGRYVWTPDAPRGHALVSRAYEKRLAVDGSPPVGFDLAADPCEVRPLRAVAEKLAAEQAAHLARETAARAGFVARHGDAAAAAFDASQAEQLRALGYVE